MTGTAEEDLGLGRYEACGSRRAYEDGIGSRDPANCRAFFHNCMNSAVRSR